MHDRTCSILTWIEFSNTARTVLSPPVQYLIRQMVSFYDAEPNYWRQLLILVAWFFFDFFYHYYQDTRRSCRRHRQLPTVPPTRWTAPAHSHCFTMSTVQHTSEHQAPGKYYSVLRSEREVSHLHCVKKKADAYFELWLNETGSTTDVLRPPTEIHTQGSYRAKHPKCC